MDEEDGDEEDEAACDAVDVVADVVVVPAAREAPVAASVAPPPDLAPLWASSSSRSWLMPEKYVYIPVPMNTVAPVEMRFKISMLEFLRLLLVSKNAVRVKWREGI